MPPHAGDSMLGVLSLSHKISGESYERKDFEQLQNLDEYVSPVFAQVKNLASLQHINEFVFTQNRTLVREKQYLQEFVKLYGQYVNLISPELRRPFATIDDQIMDLQTSVAEDPNLQKKVTKLSQLIVEAKAPVDNLVNLASRVQMRREFHFQLLQINDVIQAVVRDLSTMAEARRVAIVFKPDHELSPLFGDPDQLQEAIKNVTHNAIKFNKIGGQVTINSDTVSGDIVVRVNDTGVGIPEERMDDIWQGFTAVQGNDSGKKRPGMGLILSKFIVVAHGGHVAVESDYGAGSTFSIYLPLIFDK